MKDISKSKIEDLLRDIRKNGAFYKESALDLVNYLEGYNIWTPRQSIFYVLQLVRLIHDQADREILLAVFGLLYGYEYIESTEARREKYYRHAFAGQTWADVQGTLQKRENRIMGKLADKIIGLVDTGAWDTVFRAILDDGMLFEADDLETDIRQEIDLPLPSYRQENPVPFPFNNLPERNPYFSGREDKLLELCANFYNAKSPTRIQTISGMGGIGKTQFALEYAYKYYEDYDNGIMWLDAQTPETLAQSLFDLSEKKGLPSNDQQSFLSWLENHNNWLLIYDNVDDYGILKLFLPKSDTGHIILTSRLQQPNKGGKLLKIPVLEDDVAVSFLHKRTGHEDTDGAKALACRLGYFPLALEQAAAYIAVYPDEDYASYLKLLGIYGLGLLDDSVEFTDYPLTIKATWQISLAKIEMESARQMMNICAYCAPDNISITWFMRYRHALLGPLQTDIAEQRIRNKLIHELVRFSLFRYKDGALSLHRLLQEVIREEIGDDLRWVACCFDIYNSGLLTRDSAWSIQEIIANAPHALTVAEYVEKLFSNDIEAMLQVADTYTQFGLLAQTEDLFYLQTEFYFPKIQRAREIYEGLLGSKHKYTVEAYFAEGMAYMALGDEDRGVDLLLRATEVTQALLSEDMSDPDDEKLLRRAARIYCVIARHLCKNDDPEKGLGLFKKALHIQTELLGADHRSTQFTQLNIDLLEGRVPTDEQTKALLNSYADDMGYNPPI